MKEFYLSFNFTSEQPHQFLRPRNSGDIRKFHNQVAMDRSASPASNIKIIKITEHSAEIIE